MRGFAISVLLFTAFNLMALNCSQCNRPITGKYIKANGKAFCSEACYEKTLPKCALCGRHFRKGIQITEDPSKVYCEECAAKPICSNCRLPNDCEKLDDGRDICSECRTRAIFDQARAQEIFNQVRERMRRDLKIGTDRNIHFYLISLPDLKKRSSDSNSPGEELGLYSYTFTEVTTTEKKFPWSKPRESIRITNERFAIYALYGLTEPRLIEVCAHELAHDWMQENYPHIRALKIREGFAEYVSAEVNTLYGNQYLNARIEKNPDPTYGDGYREIAAYVHLHGFKGLLEYLSELNKTE